jgi:hypothetical protein
VKNAYLLVYSDSLGTRDEVKDCINNISTVITWRYDMPNCFYIISEYDAIDISKSIREYFNNKDGRFIVSEVTDNKEGWLPADTWYLLNNKEHKKKE